jgi:hypothetical protein
MRTVTHILATVVVVSAADPVFSGEARVPDKPCCFQVKCRFLQRAPDGKETVLWEPVVAVTEGGEAKAWKDWDHTGALELANKIGHSGPQYSVKVKVCRLDNDTVKLRTIASQESGEFTVTGFGNTVSFLLGTHDYELDHTCVRAQTVYAVDRVTLGKPVTLAFESDDHGQSRCWVQLMVESTSTPVPHDCHRTTK